MGAPGDPEGTLATDGGCSVAHQVNPRAVARVDACLAALTLEQLAKLEEAERLDRLATATIGDSVAMPKT